MWVIFASAVCRSVTSSKIATQPPIRQWTDALWRPAGRRPSFWTTMQPTSRLRDECLASAATNVLELFAVRAIRPPVSWLSPQTLPETAGRGGPRQVLIDLVDRAELLVELLPATAVPVVEAQALGTCCSARPRSPHAGAPQLGFPHRPPCIDAVLEDIARPAPWRRSRRRVPGPGTSIAEVMLPPGATSVSDQASAAGRTCGTANTTEADADDHKDYA